MSEINVLVEQRIKDLQEKSNLRKSGKYDGIPLWESFPRLGEFLPSIPKGRMLMISANSGIGKTQAWKGIFLTTLIDFVETHQNCGFKPKFLLFLLEETRDEFIDSLLSIMLYRKFKLIIDPSTLNSEYRTYLSDDILDKLRLIQSDVSKILDYLIIEDSVYNPTGAYKMCRKKSHEWGTHYMKKLYNDSNEFITHEEYETLTPNQKLSWKYSHYTPNDPEQMVIVICDNMNIFTEESGLSRHETMSRWSRDYCRKQMSKHWQWTIINIVQQSAESEKQQFDYRGGSIVNKLKPSLDGLGNNKEIARDHLVILGLFAPARYLIEEYLGYNINILKIIIKKYKYIQI